MPEALAGAALKALIVTAVGGVLVGGFAFFAQASASADTSSGFQNSNIAFEKAVHEADVVVGTSDSRVGLLRDLPDGSCEVQTWQGATRDGKVGLQVDIVSQPGICAPTTPLHDAGSATDSKEMVFDIESPVFGYANLGGRTITFDSNGAATLATGIKPDGTKTADWEDARPYKVTMSLQSRNADTSASARKSVSTGYTNVVAVTEAADELRYVPAPSADPIPGPVKITDVSRSTTTGQSVGGLNEGVAVTFTGAVCENLPTKVTASYTQQSPAAGAPVSTIIVAPLDGSETTVHLGQVPNGSVGNVQVAGVCVDGGAASSDARDYAQQLPSPAVTAEAGPAANQHAVRWTAVSSLPTRYTVTKSAAYGTELNAPHVTTALSRTYTYTHGITFGNKTDYVVNANVGYGDDVVGDDSVTTAWPTVPAATGVKWTHTGADRADSKGVVTWDYTTACPQGTTLKSRLLENRTGLANGRYDSAVRLVTPWVVAGKSYTWDPSYALQGYGYGVHVESYCESNVTPLESTKQGVQSPYFTTPMAQPAKPIWDAYNHREWVRGTDRTWSTCYYGWELPVCPTMTIDYRTFCPTGSWVGWSNFSSTSPGAVYNHAFGWQDYWEIRGLASMPVTYYNAVYQCFTPWVDNSGPDTPENPRTITSPPGDNKVVTVWRIWPY